MFGNKVIVIKLALLSLTWTLDLYKLQKFKFRIMNQSGCSLQYQCSFFFLFLFFFFFFWIGEILWPIIYGKMEFFLISAKVNHMKHTLKIHCFQYNNILLNFVFWKCDDFPYKKGEDLWLKVSFYFYSQKNKKLFIFLF